MASSLSRGILVTFEGGEGSGKSTQIARLARDLKQKGLRVFVTREPGGTRVGDAIRAILLDTRHEINAATETLLYMASRAALVREVIGPKLKKGFVVLCDRWVDATFAYQGAAGGVDPLWIRRVGRVATDGITPDLSLFLDLPVREGLERAGKRKAHDRIEKKGIRFHEDKDSLNVQSEFSAPQGF